MNRILKLFRGGSSPKPVIKLEVQDRPTVIDPDLETVLEAVKGIRYPAPAFVCLTHRNGDYLQIVGARPWCRVEYRVLKPLNHWCAFQDTPNPKYAEGATLTTGAGEIEMQQDEWFLLKDAAEIFAAFYERTDFPAHIQWRSMNEAFGI